MYKITHGSENSIDKDIYVIIDKPIDKKDAKIFCDNIQENANLIVINNGVISWCYKGTIDECNNSILATYHLHEQDYPCPIEYKLDRKYGLKMLRTIRGLLSYCSRTEYRKEVKDALKSSNLQEKLNVLKDIDFKNINNFEKNDIIEVYKFFAFQLGQTRALLEDNVELFTKNAISNYYPLLKPYLDRQHHSADNLDKFFHDFIDYLQLSILESENKKYYITKFNNVEEFLDVKNEINLSNVVVFDIDGTLMDETHRAIHREKKDWATYFDLCHLDSPINQIIELTHHYKNLGFEIWLVSGRSETVQEKTIESLKKANVLFDFIKLREQNNRTPDYVLKPNIVSSLIGKERVRLIFDDRKRVIKSFRDKDYCVIDVLNEAQLNEHLKNIKQKKYAIK